MFRPHFNRQGYFGIVEVRLVTSQLTSFVSDYRFNHSILIRFLSIETKNLLLKILERSNFERRTKSCSLEHVSVPIYAKSQVFNNIPRWLELPYRQETQCIRTQIDLRRSRMRQKLSRFLRTASTQSLAKRLQKQRGIDGGFSSRKIGMQKQ